MLFDIHIHGIYNNDYLNLLKTYFKNINYGVILASVFPDKYGKKVFNNSHLLIYLKHIENAYGFLSYPLDEVRDLGKEINISKIIGFKFYTGYYDFSEKNLDNYLFQISKIDRNNIKNVMFHGGFCNIKGENKYFDPILLEKFIIKYKKINFIISHLAQPFYEKTLYLLKSYSNVYSDISAILTRKYIQKDITYYDIKALRKIFRYIKNNPQIYNKILFGSDYPLGDINIYLKFGKLINLEKIDIINFSKNSFRLLLNI